MSGFSLVASRQLRFSRKLIRCGDTDLTSAASKEAKQAS
jgi:hypothetical protein